MPTYQYECEKCGYSFEELQSMTDKKLKKCPKCGRNSLARLIGGGSGLIFKGTGFYQTDYKNKGSSASAKETKAETKKAPKDCGTGGCGCH